MTQKSPAQSTWKAPRLALVNLDPKGQVLVEQKALELQLPVVSNQEGQDFDLLLVWTGERWQLQSRSGSPGPVSAEYVQGPQGYRRRAGGGRGQAVARAVGLKPGRPSPAVLDLTGGLGRDAFLLASLGCRMTVLERDPVVHLLLQDGFRRASEQPELDWIPERVDLHLAEAKAWLAEALSPVPDVVYLDPMHPPRGKSALVKKEMQLLQRLVGSDADSAELLQRALRLPIPRVVVKLPLRATPLAQGVDTELRGKTTRFDLYFP